MANPFSKKSVDQNTKDYKAKITDLLDKVKDLMVANGESPEQADALLYAARPRGVPSMVGNMADLQRWGAKIISDTGGKGDETVFVNDTRPVEEIKAGADKVLDSQAFIQEQALPSEDSSDASDSSK